MQLTWFTCRMSLLLLHTMKILIQSSTYAMHHWLMAVYSTVFPRGDATRLDFFNHELMPICSIFSKPKAYMLLSSLMYILFLFSTLLILVHYFLKFLRRMLLLTYKKINSGKPISSAAIFLHLITI